MSEILIKGMTTRKDTSDNLRFTGKPHNVRIAYTLFN